MTLKQVDLESTDKTDQMTNHIVTSDSLEDVVILTPPPAPQNFEDNPNATTITSTTTSGTMLLEVIAPENLPEGYTFNVTISGSNNIVAVTVPEGGVTAGQKFTTKIENYNHQVDDQVQRMDKGEWKDGICSCFRYGIFHPMVWNACCCSLIALGQVMTRLKLNYIAFPTNNETEIRRTFEIMVCITAITLFFNSILGTIMLFEVETHTDEFNNVTVLSFSPIYEIVNLVRNLMNFFVLVYTVLILTRTRMHVRERYEIHGNAFCDCCLSFWCTCCAISQIARHTTDYDVYPGKCCTYNGLPRNAPGCVDDDENVVIESAVVDSAVPIAHATIV